MLLAQVGIRNYADHSRTTLRYSMAFCAPPEPGEISKAISLISIKSTLGGALNQRIIRQRRTKRNQLGPGLPELQEAQSTYPPTDPKSIEFLVVRLQRNLRYRKRR